MAWHPGFQRLMFPQELAPENAPPPKPKPRANWIEGWHLKFHWFLDVGVWRLPSRAVLRCAPLLTRMEVRMRPRNCPVDFKKREGYSGDCRLRVGASVLLRHVRK